VSDPTADWDDNLDVDARSAQMNRMARLMGLDARYGKPAPASTTEAA
jgi:hypothetical protein